MNTTDITEICEEGVKAKLQLSIISQQNFGFIMCSDHLKSREEGCQTLDRVDVLTQAHSFSVLPDTNILILVLPQFQEMSWFFF